MKERTIKSKRLARRMIGVRKRVEGLAGRPRLAVSRSNTNIYAQIIDDMAGRTICAVSSICKDVRAQAPYGGNVKAAQVVGRVLGEKARALGVELVCFDRRGRRYHGRVKALAEAAREAGLKF